MSDAPSDRSADFDEWYATTGGSSRRDAFVRRHLGLPDGLLSSSLVPGEALDEIVVALDLSPGGTLVDLGCGRGGYGLELARRCRASLIGLDLSARAIDIARRSVAGSDDVDARFEVADITAVAMPDGTADAAVCLDVIQTIDGPAAVFTEARRILRPGARLVVTTWQALDPDDEVLPPRIARLDCGALLIAAGFTDVAVVDRPGWFGSERALWTEAMDTDPDDDPAMSSLREEATRLAPMLDRVRRVMATATSPA